jgi:hypothetical protein
MAEKQKVFPTPVDWDELYPGRFIKAVDLKGKKVTLRISAVTLEELVGDKGPQVKGLIAFEKTEKMLALNKTNGTLIKAMFGSKLPAWRGKRVTLFEDTWDGEPCIRVWGSPDIADDMEVQVALPRKRPFTKTMHKMNGPEAVKSKTPIATEPPPEEREPGSDDELESDL